MSEIAQRIVQIRKRIAEAAARVGRPPEEIELIAVSKTVDIPQVLDAYENAGQVVFGENRVQELVRKYDERFQWHQIGHLQTNKVKYIVDKVTLIHSVDSLHLAEEIDRQGGKIGRVVPILLQVNVSGEESKFGVDPGEVFSLVTKMSQMRNISLKGLMTMAPNVTNPEETRTIFRKLRNQYIDIINKNIDNVNMKYLSMGMSNDFEIAVEEGANLVRIGSSIFTKDKKMERL